MKPLILLESLSAAEIARTRMPEIPPALAAVLAVAPDPERCYRMLLERRALRDAMRFLAAALRRRVQVWWGYLCIQEVLGQARTHRAALAAKGEPGVIALTAGGLPPVTPEAVMGVRTTVPIDLKAFDPPSTVVGGVDVTDPGQWPKPRLDPDGTLRFLPPVLEPMLANLLRRPDAAERFFAGRQAFIDRLPPDRKAAFLAMDAQTGSRVQQMLGMSAADLVGKETELNFARAGVGQDQRPDNPFNRLRETLVAKKAEVQQAVDGWQARLQGMLATIPQGTAPAGLDGDTAQAASALAAVRAWILDPSDANGRAAQRIGEACTGMEQAAGLLGQACFFSGTNLNPPGTPAEVPPVPPPPVLAPNLVFCALELARAMPDTGRTPDEWLAVFLALGQEVAQGLRTWDELLHERPGTDRPWAGRPGFGRGTDSKPG